MFSRKCRTQKRILMKKAAVDDLIEMYFEFPTCENGSNTFKEVNCFDLRLEVGKKQPILHLFSAILKRDWQIAFL